MSFTHMAWASNKILPTREKITLLVLANRMNGKSGRCDPSHATLAEDAGMSVTSVKRALDQLQEHHLITIIPRWRGAVQLPNQYNLHLDNAFLDRAPKAEVTETRGKASCTAPDGAAPGGPVQDGELVGAEGATNQGVNLEGNQEENLPAFDCWWKTWPNGPRKVAWSECQKLWKDNGLDALSDDIITHTQAMKKSMAWRDGWEPSPKTYLTGRRWLDGVPPDESELTQEAGESAAGWWERASGIEEQGSRLGIVQHESETMPDYFLRVARASGPGDWIIHALRRANDYGPERLRHVIRLFGEALVPAGWWPVD